MTKGKALLGVLAGIAAGAALGVLFAPDKGANTRKNITRKGEDLADAINEKIEEKFDELTDTILGKSKNRKTQEAAGAETKS
jgi:gas vesicle protein